MNADEQTEWNYRFEERLGVLCGPMPPTEAQKRMARAEADEAIARMATANADEVER